jgi:hypothetical protein
MIARKYAPASAVSLIVWAIWLAWLWQPERQVRLHTTHFLKKVERRDWEGVRAFLAADYSDRWDHDGLSAVADARAVFAHFLFLTVESRVVECEWQWPSQRPMMAARAVVKISGTGDPLAQMVMEKVNTLQAPFAFTWRKSGRMPWEWQLTHIEQRALNVEPNASF